MKKNEYSTLILRVKAVLVDALVYAGLGITASKILGNFNDVPDQVRAIVFVFVFILYDPLTTSLLGGTIGHLIIGLRVRSQRDEELKISFPLAIIRFVFKALLGWISLLTVSSTKKKTAIHDNIVKSVVIVEKE